MRPKKFDKKLRLKKMTISTLKNPEMNAVYGGAPTGFCTRIIPYCPTYNPEDLKC